MTAIRAIETSYKGYRFRSRLEARWAVVFDALGIKWEYEAQGYVLSDGSPYLPDFRLPVSTSDSEIWVEVKGSTDGLNWERLWLAAEIHPVLILGPIPEVRAGIVIIHPCLFGRDPRFCLWMQLARPERTTKGIPVVALPKAEPTLSGFIWDGTPWAAYAAGRRARFEHGEHGS